jgi:hypothetical protein
MDFIGNNKMARHGLCKMEKALKTHFLCLHCAAGTRVTSVAKTTFARDLIKNPPGWRIHFIRFCLFFNERS